MNWDKMDLTAYLINNSKFAFEVVEAFLTLQKMMIKISLCVLTFLSKKTKFNAVEITWRTKQANKQKNRP